MNKVLKYSIKYTIGPIALLFQICIVVLGILFILLLSLVNWMFEKEEIINQ